MASVKLDDRMRARIKEAVLFGVKTGRSADRSGVLLSFSDMRLTVCAAGDSGEVYMTDIPCGHMGPPSTLCLSSDALNTVMDTADADTDILISTHSLTFSKNKKKAKLNHTDGNIEKLLHLRKEIADTLEGKTPCAVLPLTTLRRGIKEVIYAKADKSARTSIAASGITISCLDDRVEIYAVDSTRAALFSADCDGCGNARCVIPAEVASFIAASKWSFFREDTDCSIFIEENNFTFKAGELTLHSPVVAGGICKLGSTAVPGTSYTGFPIESDALSKAVDRILSISHSETSPLRTAAVFTADPLGLTVRSKSSCGEVEETICESPEHKKEDLPDSSKFALSSKLLKECLGAFQGQRFTLFVDLSSRGKPVLLKPSVAEEGVSRTHMILPLVMNSGTA